MDPELKKRWVEALRSGEYEQGTGHLRTKDEKFCCLGVLGDVAGYDWEESPGPYLLNAKGSKSGGLLPAVLNAELGIPSDIEIQLSNMNDGAEGYRPSTFEEIADYIEEHL